MAKYKTRKDRRKDRTGAAAFDTSCQCHGGCPWCEGNRTYQDRRERQAADDELAFWGKVRKEDELYLDHAGSSIMLGANYK